MTFISADLIYVAYPLLLFNKEGLFAMRNALRPNTRSENAIAKYEARGFEFAPSSIQWLNHHCGKGAYCPHTIRDIHDGSGFVFPLTNGMQAADIIRSLSLWVLYLHIPYVAG